MATCNCSTEWPDCVRVFAHVCTAHVPVYVCVCVCVCVCMCVRARARARVCVCMCVRVVCCRMMVYVLCVMTFHCLCHKCVSMSCPVSMHAHNMSLLVRIVHVDVSRSVCIVRYSKPS